MEFPFTIFSNAYKAAEVNNKYPELIKALKVSTILVCYRWHHLCFTYDYDQHVISTFLDGELNNQQKFILLSPVYGNWARLGQNFEARNSFSGDLTQASHLIIFSGFSYHSGVL